MNAYLPLALCSFKSRPLQPVIVYLDLKILFSPGTMPPRVAMLKRLVWRKEDT